MRIFFTLVLELLPVTVMSAAVGCTGPAEDKQRPALEQASKKDEYKWVPPRGTPGGGPVPEFAPHREYSDRREYEKAMARMRRRALELGRESPRTDEELRLMVHRCRKTPEELGYRKEKEGIKTGSVLVCGLFLPPPYKLSCVPEQGPKYTHYKLVVNGVTLSSNLPYDDCGWPYELVESPMMKPTECEKKVGDVLNRIEKGQKEFTESTTRKEFLAAVKRWEKMLRSIKCDEPGEVFYVESVTVDKEVQNADFFVSGGFVFSVSNRKDPKLQARWRKRFKKITPEEHARQSLEAGNMLKEYVEKHLSKLKFSQNPRQ